MVRCSFTMADSYIVLVTAGYVSLPCFTSVIQKIQIKSPTRVPWRVR